MVSAACVPVMVLTPALPTMVSEEFSRSASTPSAVVRWVWPCWLESSTRSTPVTLAFSVSTPAAVEVKRMMSVPAPPSMRSEVSGLAVVT